MVDLRDADEIDTLSPRKGSHMKTCSPLDVVCLSAPAKSSPWSVNNSFLWRTVWAFDSDERWWKVV